MKGKNNFARRFTKKLTALLLAFLFSATPIINVAAQESVVEDIEQVEVPTASTDSFSASVDSESLIAPEVSPEVLPDDPFQLVEPEEAELLEEEGISPEETPPPMELDSEGEDPNLGLNGQYAAEQRAVLPETDLSTGALTYKYPIQVPPGRNGVQPDITLEYNNQAANDASNFLGYGWGVSIPYIERINRTGSNKLYTTGYYRSSIAGELAQISSGSYGPKTDSSEFLRFTLASHSWSVIDKSGTTYSFGQTASAQQDSSDHAKKYKWMLEKVTDSNGNYISYTYFKDAGQIYPASISYTHFGSDNGIFEVEFQRQASASEEAYHTPGFSVKNNYRIARVQVNVNGQWVRRYDLGYGVGDNGQRSMLADITESGQAEDNSVTALPAVEFSYSIPEKGWESSNTGILPYPVYKHFADANGDGLVDVVESAQDCFQCPPEYQSKETFLYLRGGVEGFYTASPQFVPSTYFHDVFNSPIDQGVRLDDLNGDFRADIYQYKRSGSDITDVYINSGSGWTASSSWDPEVVVICTYDCSGVSQTNLFDINGDGLADVFSGGRNSGGGISSSMRFNSGYGWESPTYPAPVAMTEGVYVMDANGDGLNDLVQSGPVYGSSCGGNGNCGAVYLNTGDSWVKDSSWATVSFDFGDYDTDSGARVADVNGDGLPDLIKNVCGSTSQIYLNTGSGWVYSPDWDMGYDFVQCNDSDGLIRIIDFTGDGMPDISNYSGNSLINTGKKADQLIGITFSQGGTATVNYQASHRYRDVGNNLLSPKLPVILQAVQSIMLDSGTGTVASTSYVYENGDYYYDGPFDRRVSGFGKVTRIDGISGNGESAKTTTYFHQGNVSSSAWGEVEDHHSKIGKPFRIDVFDSGNNLYKRTWNGWTNTELGSGRWFVALASAQEQIYDGNASHKDSLVTSTYNSSNGNLTQQIEWGEVTGSSTESTYTDIGTDKFTTAYSYASGSLNLQLPSVVTKTDQSANKISETRNYYDSAALGTAVKGNLTKQERWKTASTYIDTEKSYNSYGLVVQEKDPRDKVASYSYDTYGLFPLKVDNALNHRTQYVYDYSSGKTKNVTDPNSRVSSSSYDGLDRLLEERQASVSSPVTLVTKNTYTYTDTRGSARIKKSEYLDSSTVVDTYIYFDGLNRRTQERKEAEGSNYAVRDFKYNSRGMLEKETVPYFSTGTASTSASGDSTLYASYSYDPLRRISIMSNAIGSTSYTYDDWRRTERDARYNSKHFYQDAYGNLIKVVEITGNTVATTSYQYNGLNLLTKITDAASNSRNFTYDGLGRRLTAEDLHASGSSGGSWYSTGGTWLYRKLITIDHTKIPGATNLTDFSILVSTSHTDLKASASGGYVQKSGGTDILFTIDNSTKLSHEIERYASVSGQVIAWVEIPSLSATASTSLYMYWGNSSASDQQDKTGTWSNSYRAVWHSKENPGGTAPQIDDSTSNANDATTNGGMASSNRRTGKIGYGTFFDGSNDYLSKGNTSSLTIPGNVTVSVWASRSLTSAEHTFVDYAGPDETETTNHLYEFLIEVGGTLKLVWEYGAGSNGSAVSSVGASGTGNTWKLYTVTRDVSANEVKFYVDGAQLGTTQTYTNDPTGGSTATLHIGRDGSSLNDYFGGYMDEFHLASVSRSADWIATEYNNQNSPRTFYTVGSTTTQSSSAPTWTYTYDDSGNMTSSLDPKSQVINYTYDDLNRNLTEDYTGQSGTEVTYAYDTCSEGKTRLCSVLTSDASISYQYNVLGLKSSERNKLGGVTYQSDYTYDRQGNMTTTLNPDNSQVKYIYNNAGMLNQIQRKESTDESFTNVISNFDYNPMGKIATQSHANGATTVNTYDAYKLYRLSNKKTTIGSGKRAQDLTYVYDANNNITRITDISQTNTYKTVDYTYDALNRLTSAISSGASGSADFNMTFGYDILGNITSKSDQGIYTYSNSNNANPHAVTSIAGSAPASSSEEMLDTAWNLSGNNGADEEYQGVDENILLGKESITVTYDLNGLCALGGDASAIIFDQDGWNYISLSDYGTNCYDGQQIVTIPLEDFSGLDIEEPLTGDLHARFWYSSAFNVGITSITISGTASQSEDVTFTYDANGNVTSYTGSSLSWSYDNRLKTVTGEASVSYAYDHVGQRVKVKNGTSTTYYPTKFYNTDGVTITKHIFTPDGALVATVETTEGDATVTLDATTTNISNGYNGGPTTKNWTHTTSSGSDRLLVLSADIWQDVGGAGTITSASYNGVALTKVTNTRLVGMASEIWYLVNPSSGSNTVSVTVTGATDSIKLSASTYTGVLQSSPLDVSNTATGESGNPTISATTATDNALVVATLSRFTTTGATTNRTSLYNDATGSTLGASSYQIATSASSYSDTYTGSSASDWSMIMAAFKPAAGTSTTVLYVHTDHLGGTNVVTDDEGGMLELLDYFPYGETRLDQGSNSEQRGFTGYERDLDTDLNYASARYQSGKWGRFISQDSVFQAMGDENRVRELAQRQQREILADPQLLNAYAYARNNPLTMKDQNGDFAQLAVAPFVLSGPPGWAIGIGVVTAGVALYQSGMWQPRQIPNVGWPSSPQGPEDMIPHLKGPNGPDWKTVVGIGTIVVSTVAEIYNESKNWIDSVSQFSNNTNKGNSGTNPSKSNNMPGNQSGGYYIGPATQNQNSTNRSTPQNEGQTIRQAPPSSPPSTQSSGGVWQSITSGISGIFRSIGGLFSK